MTVFEYSINREFPGQARYRAYRKVVDHPSAIESAIDIWAASTMCRQGTRYLGCWPS